MIILFHGPGRVGPLSSANGMHFRSICHREAERHLSRQWSKLAAFDPAKRLKIAVLTRGTRIKIVSTAAAE